MKKTTILALAAIILYALQLYVWIKVDYANLKYIKPVIMFTVSLLMAAIYFIAIQSDKEDRKNIKYGIIGVLVGIAPMLLCYQELRGVFDKYVNYVNYSDVIPQIEALYDRFASGKYPYQLVYFPSHIAFPVYLPANWLPIGITRFLDADSRWVGILFLTLAIAVFSWYVFQSKVNLFTKVILAISPSAVIWACVWDPNFNGMPVTLETLIAAYYLVLAAGLFAKNLPLTVFGIILCLLSRYTLVFWLPTFAYLLWVNLPKKYSYIVWSVVGTVVVLVLAPFFATHMDSFFEGVKYHNNCAIADMHGYGDDLISWSQESGVSFAPHFRAILNGDAEYKVTTIRYIQGALMILLNIVAIFHYRKVRAKVDFYSFALGYLYLCVLLFYMFSPLTYWYYYLMLWVLSAVLVGNICVRSSGIRQKS